MEDIAAKDLVEVGPTVLQRKYTSLTPEMREVAELLATKGTTIQRVSETSGVPISAIKKWKKRPDFQEYMTEFVMDLATKLRAYRLMMCLKTLDARIEKIEEIGDWSLFSSKDSLDIMEAMRKDTDSKEEKEQTQYIKTIEALILKSAKPSITSSAGGN